MGKTTCAAAAALWLTENTPDRSAAASGEGAADAGGSGVLVVSTDPAHSLGDALAVPLGPEPRRIATRSGVLWALELSAEAALERWLAPRRQAVADVALRGTYLDREDVERLLALTPPGVDELVALAEVLRRAAELGCGEVVVDTAPTAHTLRLLAMPEALRRFAALLDALEDKHRLLADRFGSGHEPDATDRAIAEIDQEGEALAALLRDPERTGFSWVTLAEPLAIEETRDGLAALDAAGIPVREVIVNRLASTGVEEKKLAQLQAIREAGDVLADRAVRLLPEQPREPRGLPALRKIGALLGARGRGRLPRNREDRAADVPGKERRGRRAASDVDVARLAVPGVANHPPALLPPLRDLLAPPGLRLLLFGGKGGVGKSTCAAAAAIGLAGPVRRVLLISTDPAHSLADVLEVELGDDERPVPGTPGLFARELDAEQAFDRWRARSGDGLDEALAALTGRSGLGAVLERPADQDFSGFVPPGLDEIVALVSLLDAVLPPAPETDGMESDRSSPPAEAESDGGAQPAYDLIVVDTAPTGHTLRLLALPELALTWDHALLSLLLKYREVRPPGPLAGDLVELSRGLKRFSALLRDPARARFVPVTRPAGLPLSETERLLAALDRLDIAVPAVLVNAVADAAGEERWLGRLRGLCSSRRPSDAAAGSEACAIIVAPATVPPPRGVAGLASWSAAWRTVDAAPSRRP